MLFSVIIAVRLFHSMTMYDVKGTGALDLKGTAGTGARDVKGTEGTGARRAQWGT